MNNCIGSNLIADLLIDRILRCSLNLQNPQHPKIRHKKKPHSREAVPSMVKYYLFYDNFR